MSERTEYRWVAPNRHVSRWDLADAEGFAVAQLLPNRKNWECRIKGQVENGTLTIHHHQAPTAEAGKKWVAQVLPKLRPECVIVERLS